MRIKTRLTLNFLLSVTGILILFSATVYFFYLQHRNEDFLRRLKNKATNTGTLLFQIKGVDPQIVKTIDNNTISSISNVRIIILNKEKKIIYSNTEIESLDQQMPLFERLDWNTESHFFKDHHLYMCFTTYYNGTPYFILASGKDHYGEAELKKLLIILLLVFTLSTIAIISIGYLNAAQTLKPIKEIISQVDTIKANNLNQRLAIKNNDEIDELSTTFNKMLSRLEQSFENERRFVSNVSHELRTPITSIIGQVEVSLLKQRQEKEYKALLNSILEDTRNIKTIINGFLDLAETGIEEEQHNFTILRVDELLFLVKEEILKRKPNYTIGIEFENIPEDEKEISIMGNERLIKIVLSNLIDNACKFSEHHKAVVKLGYNSFFLTLRFTDNGIGIPQDELSNILQPLYRAKNATGKSGHGIGLSIVKRIVDLHRGTLDIESKVNIGTTVTIKFPNIKAI